MIRCRIVNTNGNKKPAVWDDKSTMEWQANYMSSALLMPKSMVNKIVKEEDMLRNKVFRSLNLSSDELTIIRISRTFNVSEEAARYRLQGLGLIENNSQFSIQ